MDKPVGLTCDLCGFVGPGVEPESGKTYRQCCQDYSACETRREAALDKAYQEQLKHPPRKTV